MPQRNQCAGITVLVEREVPDIKFAPGIEHGRFAAVGLKREEEERAFLVQMFASVVDKRAAVEANQVLHGVEGSGALVGVDPRLALGRFVRQFHAQIVERFDGIVELQNSLFVCLLYTVAIRFYP